MGESFGNLTQAKVSYHPLFPSPHPSSSPSSSSRAACLTTTRRRSSVSSSTIGRSSADLASCCFRLPPFSLPTLPRTRTSPERSFAPSRTQISLSVSPLKACGPGPPLPPSSHRVTALASSTGSCSSFSLPPWRRCLPGNWHRLAVNSSLAPPLRSSPSLPPPSCSSSARFSSTSNWPARRPPTKRSELTQSGSLPSSLDEYDFQDLNENSLSRVVPPVSSLLYEPQPLPLRVPPF